ncbi:MAG: FAD-dependent oxidoreductase [Bacillota bacterium]|nr:FAD-dependent oxidoreductase [Bacillota bacterium]
MTRVLIIGGNAAGMSAASQVKRQQPDWEVTVLEKGSYISYGACGIPYYLQGLARNLEDLITITPEEAVQKRKLNLKLHHEVTAIDPYKNQVSVTTPEGRQTESFDYLVISTGAHPLQGGLDYTPSKRVYTINSLDDASNLKSFIDNEKPRSCAVIGGGYIAVEMLEALKERGLETQMIHRREDLARAFEKEISDLAKEEMAAKGIILNLNRSVSRIVEEGNLAKVYAGGDEFRFDLVIVATGVEPNSSLATGSGIETGIKGAIKVNSRMQTNFPHIYAAGDCAETKNLVNGENTYVALALKANKEGFVAGANIAGSGETFPGVLGTAITKIFDLGLARTGLTLAEAEKSGFAAFKYTITARSKAHYYPTGGALTAVLIADMKTGRLLGAQLAGPVDSVKRIDVYATALTAEMTLDQLFQLDLSYAPPFSPVYDPVVLSGRVGRKKVGGN